MTRRVASFFDLKISARGRSRAEGNVADFPATPKSIVQIKELVDGLMGAGDNFLSKGRSDNSDKYYVADSEVVDGYWVLLVNRCDPSAPDSVYSNPESNERDVNIKKPGQGSEFSAHIILSQSPVKGSDYYFCAIEASYGSGLGSNAVCNFMGHIIRHCKKQKPAEFKISNIQNLTDARGKPNLVSLSHAVELHGHVSDSFKKDLENGVLGGIELISYEKAGGKWDDAGFVKEKQRVIKLELQKDLIGDALATVKAVLKNAKVDGVAEMRVNFRDQTGSPNSAALSVDSGLMAGDGRYLKKHYISSANNVKSSSIVKVNCAIVREVLRAMG